MKFKLDKDQIRFFMYNKILQLCKSEYLTVKRLEVLTGGTVGYKCLSNYCRLLEQEGYLTQEYRLVNSKQNALFFKSTADSYPIECFISQYDKFIATIKSNGYEPASPKPAPVPKQVPVIVENLTPHIRIILGAENTRWTIAPRKSARNSVSGSTLSNTFFL